jgi:hypothetical protein
MRLLSERMYFVTLLVNVGNFLLGHMMVEEFLLGWDHSLQELEGEEVDADVGRIVHQGAVLNQDIF